MKLANKVAIITGSSRGIGRNIAVEMAKEGATIVVAARSEVENERLPGTIYSIAEQLRSTYGVKAFPVRCDVTRDDEVEEMVQKVVAEFGRIDVLVNNAGIMSPGPAAQTPMKRWDIVMRVNLRGCTLCTLAVVPQMIKQHSGSIINISSKAAVQLSSGNVYGVSKAAIERFSFGLASELKEHNIAINALSPEGLVVTEGWRYWSPDVHRDDEEAPEIMGKAAVFLAAQDAKGVTGRSLYSQSVLKEFGIE